MASYFDNNYPRYRPNIPQDICAFSKSKIVDELCENFNKFENEVWNYDRLKPEQACKIDLKLPSKLIEIFGKLFRLWRDYDAFHNLVEEDLFRHINNQMNEHFGASLNLFKVSCELCDQEIRIFNNDMKYSYELHSQGPKHQSVLKNLSYLIRCSPLEKAYEPAVSVAARASTRASVETTSSDEEEQKKDFNGYIVLTENNRLKCMLCEKNLLNDQEAIHHVTSWPHRLNEMRFSPDDTNYVIDIDGTSCCRLCRCKLPNNKQSHEQHLLSLSHKTSEECHRVLKKNEALVTLLNNDTGAYVCMECDKNGTTWDSLLRHCRRRDHRQRLSRAETPSNDLDGTDFVVFMNKRYECSLCLRTLERDEIIDHQRDKEHVEKLFAIVNNNELMDVPSSPNSSCESDGYNEAFKNNDIYIEVNLGEDDREEYKCVLCNKSGNGLDNLDAHCLTRFHQKYKSHIEKVSKAYASCDVDDPPMDAILDVEDLYYCRVCDVMFEDEDSVERHKKEKTHTQSVTLEKVLNENRDCVSTLEEEPERAYHCHLCSKSIKGDKNFVGHCNSGRHTELLNMVKALSQNRTMRRI